MEVRVDRVSKAYGGVCVLRDVSLTISPGVTAVMAPSGAGKTTLLRLVLGLERPDSGTVTVPAHTRFSAVFQEDRLLDGVNAAGNLRFVLGKSDDAERARTMLDALGLSIADGKIAGEYSGGMRRRLALARALLAPFDVLALDEPFTGLDGENRSRAIACIQKCAAGKPVLLVSHDEQDAAELHAQIFRL